MLGEELLGLSPQKPLGADEASALVASSIGRLESCGACTDFSLAGGVATGTFFSRDDGRSSAVASLTSLPLDEDIVVAIGAFDGVHRGHRALLARAANEADARGARLVAVTFSPDPAAVLGGADDADLLCAAERWQWIQSAGVDDVCVLRFTPELASLDYERFVREVLCGMGRLSAIVVGSDFCLGKGGKGTVEALSKLGAMLGAISSNGAARAIGEGHHAQGGFDVIGMDLAGSDGRPITATRIRGLLREGKVEAAAFLLGRCHFVRGSVSHGRGEGTAFGFPTANVEVAPGLLVPAEGVYAGFVVLNGTDCDSRGRATCIAYPAAINVGKPPTFAPGQTGARFLEATLLGFSGDLYGSSVSVVFCRWLRASRPFDSLDELERTVLGNIEWTRRTLGGQAIDLGEGEAS